MKSISSDLLAFLTSKQAYVWANLYTFTLSTGDVYWYTGADVDLVVNGVTFRAAPCIDDNGVSQKVGVQTDTLEITIRADARTTMGGLPIITFAKQNGLDGAVVSSQRVYYPMWGMTPVGVLGRFQGRFSEFKDASRSMGTAIVAGYTELLNTNMPIDVYQGSCLNTLFDAKCTLIRSNFGAAGAIDGASTQRLLATNIMASAGTYSLGSVTFTSGANSGERRTITSQDVDGNLQLVSPLPITPTVGDTFAIYPGCDLSRGTCGGKFNNLINYRGQDFIPTPESAI